MYAVRTIYGIDFSGAKDAGNKIWIAKGAAEDKSLLIKECSSPPSAVDLMFRGKWG
jgi:hypothetical protein